LRSNEPPGRIRFHSLEALIPLTGTNRLSRAASYPKAS
jgi:hypothetical protein